MASKIREVLEVEPVESYVKKPTGPMRMVKIQDISKLTGHICIPSLVENATPNNTIL
jgi:hypothetical protein